MVRKCLSVNSLEVLLILIFFEINFSLNVVFLYTEDNNVTLDMLFPKFEVSCPD